MIEFQGRKYSVGVGTYYRTSGWDGPRRYLHRDIWEAARGPIPKGWHVHHRDGNPLNNDIENLELLEHAEHIRHHAKTFNEGRQPNSVALKRAAEWHASEEGRAWHREHASKPRRRTEINCVECGTPFMAALPNRVRRPAQYCGPNCYARAYRRRIKLNGKEENDGG